MERCQANVIELCPSKSEMSCPRRPTPQNAAFSPSKAVPEDIENRDPMRPSSSAFDCTYGTRPSLAPLNFRALQHPRCIHITTSGSSSSTCHREHVKPQAVALRTSSSRLRLVIRLLFEQCGELLLSLKAFRKSTSPGPSDEQDPP